MRRIRVTAAGLLPVLWLCLGGWGMVCAEDFMEVFSEAMTHSYAGDLDRAEAGFRKALTLDPDNEVALNHLGIVYAKKQDLAKAEAVFLKVSALNPHNVQARTWLGILHLRKRNLDEAYRVFQELAQLDPNSADAYYYLGSIYRFRHNRAKAIEYLKKSRDANSVDPSVHFRLAQAFDLADMPYNALLEYERVLQDNPKHTKALNAKGWIYYNLGDVQQAIDLWNQSLSINPKDREAVLSLAKVYNSKADEAFKQGRKAEAVELWRKTQALDPSNKAAEYFLKRHGR